MTKIGRQGYVKKKEIIRSKGGDKSEKEGKESLGEQRRRGGEGEL